jgi:hypothetical protein
MRKKRTPTTNTVSQATMASSRTLTTRKDTIKREKRRTLTPRKVISKIEKDSMAVGSSSL